MRHLLFRPFYLGGRLAARLSNRTVRIFGHGRVWRLAICHWGLWYLAARWADASRLKRACAEDAERDSENS